MEFTPKQEKVAELIAQYLLVELENKTNRSEFTKEEDERLEVALNNICYCVFDDPRFRIVYFTDQDKISDKEYYAKAEEIKNETLAQRKDLIEAARKCYADNCSDLQKLVDDILDV